MSLPPLPFSSSAPSAGDFVACTSTSSFLASCASTASCSSHRTAVCNMESTPNSMQLSCFPETGNESLQNSFFTNDEGQMDTVLNEVGRQQAVVVARRLSREAKPAAVYSSDLRRAAETAEIIATACGVSNVVLNEALRERRIGYLQGLTWDDVVALDAFRGFDIFNIYKGSDPDSRNQELPGGGESINQLNERCVSYLNKISQQHIGERVVVVSHGATIAALCWHTDPPDSFIRRHIPNTSLNVFRVSGVTGQWTLERYGDVSHLEGNGFLEDSFGGNGASA